MRRLTFIAFATAAIGIGLYPVIYFLVDRRFGLLQTKTAELLQDGLWNAGFYMHIVFGGIALLSGWSQFHNGWRRTVPVIHRNLGKLYVLSVLFSGTAGLYLSWFASGGWVAKAGFAVLAVIWLRSTVQAWQHIRVGDIVRHREAMIYSYAACFAAVMLRVWLPVLSIAFGAFDPAYRIVAWLCWVPNMLVAIWLVRRQGISVSDS